MKINKKKTAAVSGLLLCSIILFIFYYYYHQKVHISSDTTTLLPMADAVLNGNFLLKTWILGTNNFYFTDMIFYALGHLIGFSYELLINFLPGVFHVLTALFFVLYFFDFSAKEVQAGISASCALLCFSIIGIVAYPAAYTLLNANSHNNLYLFVCIAFACALKFTQNGKHSHYWLVLYMIISVLCGFSDSVTTMILVGPVIVWCFIHIVKIFFMQKITAGHTVFKNVILMVASAFGFILAKIVRKAVSAAGGLITRGIPMSLVSPKWFLERIIGFTKQFLVLLGISDLYTPEITISYGIYYFTVILFFILLITVFIYRTIFIFKMNDKELFLYLVSVINVIGCIFTTVVIYHRYIIPAFLFGTTLTMITTAQWISGLNRKFCDNPLFNRIFTIIISVASVFIVCTKAIPIKNMPLAGDINRQIVQTINEKQWGNGYGDFWSSSINTYYSGFNIDIYPITLHKDTEKKSEEIYLEPYHELISTEWYKEKDKHYIIIADSAHMLDSEKVLTIVGSPDDSVRIGEYTIYYWEKDISEYIKSSY